MRNSKKVVFFVKIKNCFVFSFLIKLKAILSYKQYYRLMYKHVNINKFAIKINLHIFLIPF